MTVVVDPFVGYTITALATICFALCGWVLANTVKIKIDVEVMKNAVSEAIKVAGLVQKNSENIIRMDERQDRLRKDMNVLHNAKRDLYEKIARSNHL